MESEQQGKLRRGVRPRSAIGLVVASMIGAGIFTTTGFQAADLGHPGWIAVLWLVGGVLALAGALCFAELGASMPKAGAEYVYIREAFGDAAAFSSAFVAIIAGFSAPIAGALKSFVVYVGHFVPALVSEHTMLDVAIGDWAAIAIGWLIVLIHVRGITLGLGFNDVLTFAKVAGIVVLIIAAFGWGEGTAQNFSTVAPVYDTLSLDAKLSAFATSLIFVTFCYLGWNASAYMAAEMSEPEKTVPQSLLIGTALVTGMYVLLNLVYFYAVDVTELAGKVDVGVVAATALFGPRGVDAVTVLMSVSILASASAMTVIGPRVYYAFGTNYPPLKFLGSASASTGAPVQALILQGIVTTVIILSGTVDQIYQYAGFTLTLFASLAVACVIVLRIRRPDLDRPFKTWGYPWTPLLFIGVSLWTMVWAVQGRPVESLLGLATAVAGGLLFYVSKVFTRK